MTTVPPVHGHDAVSAAAPAATLRATTGQHLITLALGWWLVAGLFIDGWAHNNLGDNLETFFTPWHAIFYSGFAAVAGWCMWLASHGWQAGRRGLAAFPDGYHLAALGVPLFGVSGVGDLVWHTAFGVEVGIDALLSPTHLGLFTGGALILASPLNAVWRSDAPRRAAGAVRWVAVLSAASLLAVTAFMHMYVWGLLFVPQGGAQTRGDLAGILLTALIMAAPVLLLLRRFSLPFGAVAVMYVVPNTAMALMVAPGDWRLPALALGFGLLADVLHAWLQPSPRRVWALRAYAVLMPLCVWVIYLGALLKQDLNGLTTELWLGVSVMAALGGLALSALIVPAPVPAAALDDA